MQQDPTALLKKHGKTFNFARLFLGKTTGIAAARLYQFCRIVDDIADETSDKIQAKENLQALTQAIIENNKAHPVVGDFLVLCEQFNVNRNNGIILIEGVSEDLGTQALNTERDLIQYAYKVAGVVGLMMAPILGANKSGQPFAVDLGIAMQLTNIARDVMEDARMDRRYIPGAWVKDLSAKQIALGQGEDKSSVQSAVSCLLGLAEEYYRSGLAGLYFLPYRNRQAIAVAAYAYREIGRKLSVNNYEYWQERTVVGKVNKVKLAAQALWHLATGELANSPPIHHSKLHLCLQHSPLQYPHNNAAVIAK